MKKKESSKSIVLAFMLAAIPALALIFAALPAMAKSQSNAPAEDTVVNTTNLPGTIEGYAGDVPLEIHIAGNKITEIKALPNYETPSYFARACVLLNEWVGKTTEEALTMEVDAVSGATYSSDAIINNVRVGLQHHKATKSRAKNKR